MREKQTLFPQATGPKIEQTLAPKCVDPAGLIKVSLVPALSRLNIPPSCEFTAPPHRTHQVLPTFQVEGLPSNIFACGDVCNTQEFKLGYDVHLIRQKHA